MLSMKNLVFRERLTKKLTERYVGLYVIEEVVSKNAVILKLPASMRIHPVVNMSRVVRYRELEKGQEVKKPKPVEVDGVEEQEVEKILNKKKVRGVMKYLVWQKGFTAENDTQEKEEDLDNTKEVVAEFKGRMNAEVRRQGKVNITKKRGFRQGELLEKYATRILYKQNDRKFEKKYLRKLERNWAKWKKKTLQETNSFFSSRNLEEGIILEL